jgi:Effector Associated Constant Component 1
MSTSTEAAPVAVHLKSDRFEEDDERWAAQRTSFFAELRREVGSVDVRSEPVPGTKGATETTILALGTAGAFQAAAACFQAWLTRDRTRRIELTWIHNGSTESFVLDGSGVDEETFQRLAAKLQQFGVDS